jgi:tetratricopeptide (TPR) repeat protein
MPAMISGTRVATPEDINRLETWLSNVATGLSKLQDDTNTRFADHTQRLNSLTAAFNTQKLHLDKLSTDLQNLDTALKEAVQDTEQTLDGIVGEIQQSDSLLKETNQYLSAHGDKIEQIATTANRQANAETARRLDLEKRLEEMLGVQKSQYTALRQAFSDLQAKLVELAVAEKMGAEMVERSIRVLRDTVTQVQDQTQSDLTRTSQAVQEYTRAKNERAKQEADVYARLISIQEQMHARLESIETVAGLQALSGTQSQEHQQDLMHLERAWQANELNQEAALLLRRGDYSTAVLLLEQAIELSPQDLALQTNLAHAWSKTGQIERAESLLLATLEIEPGTAPVHNQLGVLYLEKGDSPAALPYLQRAAELEPDSGAILINLGKAYFQNGRIALAMEAWQRARQVEPGLVNDDVAVKLLLEG